MLESIDLYLFSRFESYKDTFDLKLLIIKKRIKSFLLKVFLIQQRFLF